MEISNEQTAEGGQYLGGNPGRYRWEYWVGVSLWTGGPLIFEKGVDFICSVEGFQKSCNRTAKNWDLMCTTSTKDLPKGKISVLWYKKGDLYLGKSTDRPREWVEIPEEMRTGYVIPELAEEVARMEALERESRGEPELS